MEISPRLAFEKVSLLRDPVLRERLRRDAFLAMTRSRPKEAAALLSQVIDARWLPAVNFAQALDVAWFTVRDQPELSKRFLMATAGRHPALALREVRQYIELPYGPAIRDAARSAATPQPDLLLLQIRQNPSFAQSLSSKEILRLAAAATTEDERDTALTLLRNFDWTVAADPSDTRGALALLAESGAPLKVPLAAVRLALREIETAEDPLAEAVKAAAIIAVAPPEADEALPDSTIGRLLHAQRNPSARNTTLPLADLFPNGLCLQRYIFHNDDDGVESFESFLRSYADDPNWTIEKTESLVHLTGRGAGQRRIEIYANTPVDLQLPVHYTSAAAVGARQGTVTATMPARPTVLVHRGHDHHFDVTRKFLKPEARLVFLGSCHGMTNVEDVVTRCRRAQMIATRGVGTTSVNDAFLRALNRQLLAGGDSIDWDRFWASLGPALGANEHFLSYVPPHRNAAARFLSAWYREVLSAP